MSEKPTVSKQAERRIKDRLPAPAQCPHCNGLVELTRNATVYGRDFGEWPWIYLCRAPACGAYVGTYPSTLIPLGTLATATIRAARKTAKEQFNRLWHGGNMSRAEAYDWLAAKLEIPLAACHFGWLDEAQCKRVLQELTIHSRPRVRTAVADQTFAHLRTILGARVPTGR